MMNLRARSNTDRIYAIIETNQPTSMNIDQIAYEMWERFGVQPQLNSVRKAVHRLNKSGLVAVVADDVGDGLEINTRLLVTVT